MEKTFYLYRLKNGTRVKMFSDPMPSLEGNLYEFLGTITLPVTPPLKEVVREIVLEERGVTVGSKKMYSAAWVPIDAYDVKITYKVKE